MAKTKNKNKSNPVKKMVVEYLQQNMGAYRRELNNWRNSRELRYDVDYPSTYATVEVYKDSMVDTHLTAITENRILRITNLPIEILKADGSPDNDLTKLIQKSWFTDTLRLVMESVLHGYSLIQIKEVIDGRIKKVGLIPREHVIPEKEWIVYNVTDTDTGLPYNEYPNDLLYAQMYDAYGLLEKAVPLTILKRHSWGSWDEFEQKFSLPLMIAKVAGGNNTKRREVAAWMQELGRNATGVFDIGTDIEIADGNKSDAYQVFLQKINSVNSELSKLINGQTMTVDSGSSRSQGEVHQVTQDEITKADIKEILSWLNDVLKPALINIGYPLTEENLFSVQKTINPSEKIKIDKELMKAGYKPTKDYIERIYGVELEEGDPDPEPKKKSSN